MADTMTSAETSAGALTGAELVRVVQGGVNKKTTTGFIGHQFRGAKIRMTSDDLTQNVTTEAAITFDSAEFDTDTFFSGGTPNRLTITAADIDYVALTGQVNISASTADSSRYVSIHHFNSSNVLQRVIGQRFIEAGGTSWAMSCHSGPIAVAQNDYFQLKVREETDSSVTIEGDDASVHTFLSLVVLGTS